MWNKLTQFFNNLFKSSGTVPAPQAQPLPSAVEVPKQVQRVYDAMRANGTFGRQRYIAEIDYSLNSRSYRLFVYDMNTGKLYSHKVAHGQGGKNGTPHDGVTREVSNRDGSHMSCLGLFRCAETYDGTHAYSMRLDGLSPSNSNARMRAVVMHASDYVNDKSTGISGRSWGCPALDQNSYRDIITKLKNGSPLLSHYKGNFTI